MEVDSQDTISDGEITSEAESESESDRESDSNAASEVEENETESEKYTDIDDRAEADLDQSRDESESRVKCKGKKRLSVDDKLDNLSNVVLEMHALMKRKGLYDEDNQFLRSKKKKTSKEANQGYNKGQGQVVAKKPASVTDHVCNSNSDTTVYNNGVQFVPQGTEPLAMVDEQDPEIILNFRVKNRESSSSEGQIDTSDELMEIDADFDNVVDKLEGETSRMSKALAPVNPTDSGRVRGEQRIRAAEAAKARMLTTPGNDIPVHEVVKSVLVDQNYMSMGIHVDEATRVKIINNEYVDFGKLIPRDKIAKEDDHRLELVSRNGSTFFVPASDHDLSQITGFGRWEQAFRVFSNIYTQRFLKKASELIQYNQVIFTASLSFSWDNVYRYDHEF